MNQSPWEQTKTIFMGLVSIVVIIAKWGWAKLHGRDYNAGDNT